MTALSKIFSPAHTGLGGVVSQCSECDSYHDVKAIQWRKGIGKSSSWWPTKEYLCVECRKQFYCWRYFR